MTTTPTLRDAAQALAEAYDQSPYHRPDGAFRDAVDALRAALAAPADTTGLAHEIWAVAQLAPGEGIEDGVARIAALLPVAPADALAEPDVVDWATRLAEDFADDCVKAGYVTTNAPSREALRKYLDAQFQQAVARALEYAAAECDKLSAGTLAAQEGPAETLHNVMLRQVATLGHQQCAAAIRAKGQQ